MYIVCLFEKGHENLISFRVHISPHVKTFALEICDDQFSITHAKPDHGVRAHCQVNVITGFEYSISLYDKRGMVYNFGQFFFPDWNIYNALVRHS